MICRFGCGSNDSVLADLRHVLLAKELNDLQEVLSEHRPQCRKKFTQEISEHQQRLRVGSATRWTTGLAPVPRTLRPNGEAWQHGVNHFPLRSGQQA